MAAYAPRNGNTSTARRVNPSRLVALAYILAISMPPLGFGLGALIAVRFGSPRSKHGVWIIAISIVASVIWVLVFTSGALNTTGTDY